MQFWHNLALKYIPLKSKIIKEAEKVRKKLFNESKNVLGVLIRGTDYISKKPKGHPIQPDPNIVIKDVKEMDKKNKYDWIFLATEDDNIRTKFIKEFGDKVKMVQTKNINYKDGYLADNENLRGIEFQKIYLLSMLTLSKCLDVIITRCSGAMGAFIFSEGFRESLIYFLGYY